MRENDSENQTACASTGTKARAGKARRRMTSTRTVTTRWGVADDPEAAFETLKGWMDAQPSGIEGRRQMPNFNLTDEEVRALADFLRWVDSIDAQGWPPNDAG